MDKNKYHKHFPTTDILKKNKNFNPRAIKYTLLPKKKRAKSELSDCDKNLWVSRINIEKQMIKISA